MKEKTFMKQVERTAKRDAYLTAIRYIEMFGPKAADYLKDKAASHSQYLDNLPLVYDYATQTLVEKEIAIDGNKLDKAVRGLGNSLAISTTVNEIYNALKKLDGYGGENEDK